MIVSSKLHAGLGAHVVVEHVDPTYKAGEPGGGRVPGGHEGMTKAQTDYAAKKQFEETNGLPTSAVKPPKPPKQVINEAPTQANESGFSFGDDSATSKTSAPTENQPQNGFRGSSKTTISNQLHNAFSISGNKRSTATDAHGDKIVTTTGPNIKNSDGTITPGKIISKITTRTNGTMRTEVYKTDGTISEVQEVGKKSIDGQQITEVTDGTGKKLRTIKTTDSTSRLLNNKTVEITTYDAQGEHPIETKTYNSKNQLIQKSTIDPKTGIKTTIKYKSCKA